MQPCPQLTKEQSLYEKHRINIRFLQLYNTSIRAATATTLVNIMIVCLTYIYRLPLFSHLTKDNINSCIMYWIFCQTTSRTIRGTCFLPLSSSTNIKLKRPVPIDINTVKQQRKEKCMQWQHLMPHLSCSLVSILTITVLGKTPTYILMV